MVLNCTVRFAVAENRSKVSQLNVAESIFAIESHARNHVLTLSGPSEIHLRLGHCWDMISLFWTAY